MFQGICRNVGLKPFLSALALSALFVCTSNLLAQGSVTLAWDPSPDPNVVGYVLHYGTSSRDYTTTANVGNQTTATVRGLDWGVTYFFVVTAYDASGVESDLSNEVSYTPTNPVKLVPLVVPGATPTSGTVPLTVQFDGSRSSDPSGSMTTCQWDFGDGSSAQGSNLAHTYTSAGIYTATLTVADALGYTSSSNVIISVASNLPPAAAGTPYVTGQVLGSLRNDYSGYLGMQIVVGANPITVTALGRMMAEGNRGTHTLKLVNASNGTDVAGGSVTVGMSGGAVGRFWYGSLSSPVTLAAGTTYWVLSQETAGGDNWYGWDTKVSTTGVAADNAVAWGTGPGAWYTYKVANQAFVPVDLKYASNTAPSTTGYVTGQVLGSLRNDYSGYLGMQIVVGANPITVTALGRMMAEGNRGTHTLKLVNASNGTDVAGGSVTVGMSGGAVGRFWYGSLSSPVTLAAGATYYVLSQETAGGDNWYGWDTKVSTTRVAADNAVAWGTGPGAWYTYKVANQAFVPVDFK